jgi:sigma-B regulation protein RsbU (phosphoserine phosphatase)
MTTSITSKLIALLTFCSAAILTVGMAIDYHFSREEIITRLQLESSKVISGVVNDLEVWLSGVEASTLFFGRVLEQRVYSHQGLEQLLRDIVEQNTNIFGAAVALNPKLVGNPKGYAPYYYHNKDKALTYINLANAQEQYWEQTWFADAQATGKPIWVEPYFDEGGAEVLMTTFSVPVFRVNDYDERYLYAVVTADVALDELQQYTQRMRLGKRGFGVLLSRQGTILSPRNPLDMLPGQLNASEERPLQGLWDDLVVRALEGQEVTHRQPCPQLLGDCIVKLSTLNSTGWPVGVIYSESEMLEPLREYQTKTALLGLVTLLVLSLAVSVVTRRITQPLVALAGITDEIARGELDTPLPASRGRDEVARLISAFASMKENLKTYIGDLEVATAARSRLEGELAAAREIQMAMLPQGGEALEQTEAYSLWATVRPAKTVGGDLYTYYSNERKQLFIALGDVSDKGVPAALFMAKTISHIQQFSEAFSEPARGMALLNDALEYGNSNCMFVTLFFGVLDLASGELRFASAGHTAPSLLRAGRASPVTQKSGPALGLVAKLEFPENTIHLQPGDRLAIYSDGIDEAFNEHAQMFGCERLDRGLEDNSADTVEATGNNIIRAIDNFAGTTPQSDDISLMLIELTGRAGGAMPAPATQSFAPDPLLTSRAGDWLNRELRQRSQNELLITELMLVSEEILTNINKYAGLDSDSEIEITIASDESGIRLTFSDGGIPFNPLADAAGATLGADIESAEIGGLGVHLITELTEQQHYQRRGERNVLWVSKPLSTHAAK